MKKLILLSMLFTIFLSTQIFANFWEQHFYMNEQTLDQPFSSYYKDELIRGRENIMQSCNALTDITILWYLQAETRKNYMQSHVRTAYQDCWYGDGQSFSGAGSDKELQVCCLGMGTHITQDAFSAHGYKGIKGLVPECIETYWGSNLLYHAACENAANLQTLNSMTSLERQRIILAAGNAYDLFATEPGETCREKVTGNKYVELLADSFGFDSTDQRIAFYNALCTIGDYVKTGQGSGYSNLHKNFSTMPKIWFIVPIILQGLAIIGMFAAIRFGRNKWKWVLFGLSVLITLFFIYYLTAILSGQAYSWFKSWAVYIPTGFYSLFAGISIIGLAISFGLKRWFKGISIVVFAAFFIFSLFVLTTIGFGKITIPDNDKYIQKGIESTVDFLKTGELAVANGHGLDFWEGNKFIEGTLVKAEQKFEWVQYLFVAALFYLITVVSIQMRRKK